MGLLASAPGVINRDGWLKVLRRACRWKFVIQFFARSIGLMLIAIIFSAAIVVGMNLWVIRSAAPYLYDSAEHLPTANVALILGASPYSLDGRPSGHFQGRIHAAVELFTAGRVRHLLASGSNPDRRYNEPRKMFEALTAAGVPESAITMDFAGRRTLDSVVRARAVFGQQRLVIVSQRYHLHRAIFLARQRGVDAVGYVAPRPQLHRRVNAEIREVAARVLAILDIYVLNTEPHFLGELEPISLEPG